MRFFKFSFLVLSSTIELNAQTMGFDTARLPRRLVQRRRLPSLRPFWTSGSGTGHLKKQMRPYGRPQNVFVLAKTMDRRCLPRTRPHKRRNALPQRSHQAKPQFRQPPIPVPRGARRHREPRPNRWAHLRRRGQGRPRKQPWKSLLLVPPHGDVSEEWACLEQGPSRRGHLP